MSQRPYRYDIVGSFLRPAYLKEARAQFANGEISKDEAIDLIKRNSRRYAKRQYTYFNNQLDVKWFDVDYENFNNTINNVLKYIANINKMCNNR